MRISEIMAMQMTDQLSQQMSDNLMARGVEQPTREEIEEAFDNYKHGLKLNEQGLIDVAIELYNAQEFIAIERPLLNPEFDSNEILDALEDAIVGEVAERARLKDIEVANYESLVLTRIVKMPLREDCNFLFIRKEITRLIDMDYREDIRIRYMTMYNYDAGMPAFSMMYPDKPNATLFFEKEIFEMDKETAHTILADIEQKHDLFKAELLLKKDVETKIAIGKMCRDKCTRALDYITAHNASLELDFEQVTQMQKTFANPELALRSGRPHLASVLISGVAPDGTIITDDLKSKVLAILS